MKMMFHLQKLSKSHIPSLLELYGYMLDNSLLNFSFTYATDAETSPVLGLVLVRLLPLHNANTVLQLPH
jgi:hypothetical protein